MGVGGWRHAPAALPPVTIVQGGYQWRYGKVQKISPSTKSDPRTVQQVASGNVLWVTLYHINFSLYIAKEGPGVA
jgi:hypothetical protein